MNKQVTTDGASAGTSGYEFQFTWTARRCISMIQHNSKLQQIVVEGPSDDDMLDFGQGPETFLGVDMAEYYEGESFREASRVVISQVKCSISRPNTAWSIARLCKKKTTPKSSVIGRLASAFQGYYTQTSQKELINKLLLQVVSNCDIASKAKDLIEAAQDALSGMASPQRWSFSNLKKSGFRDTQLQDLDNLKQASGLKSNEFCVFLKCLDVSKFSIASSVQQYIELIKEIESICGTSDNNPILKLCSLIRELAKKSKGSIKKEDVLACFGTDERSLLPAPCLIEFPTSPVETEDRKKFAKILKEPGTRKLVVYGEAGVGKSVTARTVGNLLPSESLTIVYDCFAGGKTGTPDRYRFPETTFCTQIVNELAMLAGQDLYMVDTTISQAKKWQKLQSAIKHAALNLKKQNAYLVLIIDAADNAAEAYENHKDLSDEKSFIPTLWNIDLPDNARLVYTCRGFRRSKLFIPKGTQELELKGFSLANSHAYLEKSFPEVTFAEGTCFHEKTLGIPRHQAYWLAELKEKPSSNVSTEIKNGSQFGLNDLYEDWFTSAQSVLPPKVPYKKILGILKASSSPISLKVVSECLGIGQSSTLDFCRGLGPGILLDDSENSLIFRDEDYETFLDGKLDEEDTIAAHNILADHCLRTLELDTYSVKNACRLLFYVKRYDELLRIVLAQSGLDIISSPIEKNRCEHERINLAFKSVSHSKNFCSAIKLLFETGRINRTNSLLDTIIYEYPMLALRHHSLNVIDQALSAGNSPDSNQIFFHIAEELSVNEKSKKLAKNALNKATSWLRAHIIETNDKGYNFRYDIDDGVAHAISELNLNGFSAAKQTVRCGISKKVQIKTVHKIFVRLKYHFDNKQILRLYQQCPPNAVVQAAAISGMNKAGILPPKSEIKRVASKLLRWQTKYGEKYNILDGWVVSFLEIAASVGTPKYILSGLSEKINILTEKNIYRTLMFNEWIDEWDVFTRLAAIKSVLTNTPFTIETIFPDNYSRLQSEKPSYRSTHSALEQISKILPIYRLEAQANISGYSEQILSDACNSMEQLKSSSIDHWDRYEPLYGVGICSIARMLSRAKRSCEPGHIEKLMNKSEDVLGYDPVDLYMKVAEILSPCHQYKDFVIDLISKVRLKWCKPDNLRASEQARRLMECSMSLITVDIMESSKCFNLAIDAASYIDKDASSLVSSLATISSNCANNVKDDTRKSLARKITKLIEQYLPLMEEDEHIPWGTFVKTIATLDSSTGLSFAFNLNANEHVGLDQIANELAHGLINGKQIPDVHATSLQCFSKVDIDYVKISIQVIDHVYQNSQSTANRLFKYITRDVMLQTHPSQKAKACNMLLEWANTHGINIDQTNKLNEFRDFYSSQANWDPSPNECNIDTHRNEKAVSEYLETIKKIKADSLNKLNDILADEMLPNDSTHTLLMQIAGQMRGNKRYQFLQALIDQEPSLYSDRKAMMLKLITCLILKWQENSDVIEWARINIPKYFEDHFLELLNYEAALPQEAIELIETFCHTDEEKLSLIIAGLKKHGYKLSPQAAYATANLLAKYIPEQELETLPTDLMNKHLSITNADSVTKIDTNSLAQFIYRCFEQPDNRIRWQCFHAARRMLSLEPEPLLAELIKYLSCTDGIMWMSAREWLLFLFLHLTHNNQKIIAPYADEIYAIMVNEEFPHAGMQELAKQILLLLVKSKKITLSSEQLEYLFKVNVPTQTLWPLNRKTIKSSQDSKRHRQWRFNFDSMDTMPYWYSRLGHCFGLHRCDVADRAELWICDKWKISNTDCYKYSQSHQRSRDYLLFSHRHGGMPTIETLSTFTERHAMHMAAGEMIRSLPIVPTEYCENSDWHDWIERNCFHADPIVMSDIITTTPLTRLHHGIEPDNFTINSALKPNFFYDNFINHKVTGKNQDWIIVGAEYTCYVKDYRVRIDIESILTPNEKSMALGRAMLTSETPWDISFAKLNVHYGCNIENIDRWLNEVEDGYNETRLPSSENEFNALSFISSFHPERDLHSMDPRLSGLSGTWDLPINDFIKQGQLKRLPGSLIYENKHNDAVAVPESWEYRLGNYESDLTGSYGHQLNIRQQEIYSYLKQSNHDLLIKVIITRSPQKRDWSKDENHEQRKVFILNQKEEIIELE